MNDMRLGFVLFLSLSFIGCDVVTVVPLATPTPSVSVNHYAYSVGYDNNVTLCSLDSSTGILSSCAVSNGNLPGADAYGIALHAFGGVSYIYVAAQGTGNQHIYQCTLTAATGALNICTQTDGGVSSWSPIAITFDSSTGTTFAYVSDYSGNIYQCTVTSSGALNVCTVSNGGASGWNPNSIVFNSFGGTTYAYVSDDYGHVYNCTVLGSGALNACIQGNGGVTTWEPTSISFHVTDGTTYAYVSDLDYGDLYQCGVTGGALTGCTAGVGGISGWYPFSVTFSSLNGNTVAYVADTNGNIDLCNVDSTSGSINTCSVNNGGDTTFQPRYVIFSP